MTTETTTDRGAWLDWRRSGLGGSDIAAVLGLSPWQSPWSLWAEKVGLVLDDRETEAMEFGRRIEPVLAPWFTERTGLHVVGEQTWCTHPATSWMRCTVDGFAAEHPDSDLDAVLGPVEFKATSTAAGEWEREVPIAYQAQATWQMLVTGFDRCWFGVLHLAFGRPTFRVYQFTLDLTDADTVLEAARTFWTECVLAGTPPPTDASDATRHALNAAWPHDDDQAVELDDDVMTTLRDLGKLKAEAKALDAAITGAENAVKAALGEHAVGLHHGAKCVSWRTQSTKRLDTAALRASHPDLAAEFTTESTSRVLRLHAIKED